MKCPNCNSENTYPIHQDNTLLECSVCNARFHIYGVIQAQNIKAQIDKRSSNYQMLASILGDIEEEDSDGYRV